MLDNLKRFFKTAEAVVNEEDLEMKQNTEQPQVDVSGDLSNELEAATASLVAKETELAQLSATVAELSQKLADAETQLASHKEHQEKLVEDAKQAKLSARKQQIIAAVGTAKADALMVATENLEDAAFVAVIEAMSGQLEAETSTTLFKEQGASVAVDAELVEQSPEMKLLKQKYQSA